MLPLRVLLTRPLLLLIPIYCFIAFEAVFYQTVLPNAVGFNLHLGRSAKSLLALVGFAGAGAGGAIGGLLSSPINRLTSRRSTVLLGGLLVLIAAAIAVVNLPRDASLHPSSGPTWMRSSPALLVLSAALFGIGDAFVNTQMLTLIRDSFGGAEQTSAYTILHLSRSLASALAFSLAAWLQLDVFVGLVVAVGAFAMIGCGIVDGDQRRGRYRPSDGDDE